MVTITLEVPGPIALVMSQRAHDMGLELNIVYVAQLASVVGGVHSREHTVELHQYIARMVTEYRWCDADIAADMKMTTTAVAQIRRSMGLPANPRRWKKD